MFMTFFTRILANTDTGSQNNFFRENLHNNNNKRHCSNNRNSNLASIGMLREDLKIISRNFLFSVEHMNKVILMRSLSMQQWITPS